jgi:hypothetical protein
MTSLGNTATPDGTSEHHVGEDHVAADGVLRRSLESVHYLNFSTIDASRPTGESVRAYAGVWGGSTG